MSAVVGGLAAGLPGGRRAGEERCGSGVEGRACGGGGSGGGGGLH